MGFDVTAKNPQHANFFLGISQGAATPIIAVRRDGIRVSEGETHVAVDFETIPLPSGGYFLWFAAFEVQTGREITPWQPIGPLLVEGGKLLDPTPKAIVRLSPVFVEAQWTVSD